MAAAALSESLTSQIVVSQCEPLCGGSTRTTYVDRATLAGCRASQGRNGRRWSWYWYSVSHARKERLTRPEPGVSWYVSRRSYTVPGQVMFVGVVSMMFVTLCGLKLQLAHDNRGIVCWGTYNTQY